MDDGIDRHLWIIRLSEKIPLFSTLRWSSLPLLWTVKALYLRDGTYRPLEVAGNGLDCSRVMRQRFSNIFGPDRNDDCSAPNRSSLNEGSHLTGQNSLPIESSGLWYSTCRGFHRWHPSPRGRYPAHSHLYPVGNGVITSDRLNAKPIGRWYRRYLGISQYHRSIDSYPRFWLNHTWGQGIQI